MNPVFVKHIPSVLEKDTLYISREFEVAIHICPCGCEEKVVTPISLPDGWKLTVDKEKVSLDPSIGNFKYNCNSHYWIKNNEVTWA